MGLGDVMGKLNLMNQLRKEVKDPGFSFKVMAVKAAKTVGWTLLGIMGVAVAGYLMDTPAIKEALTQAGLPDAMAGVVAMGLLWIGKSIANAVQNSKQKSSPVDGEPINVQAATKSGPVFTTEDQFAAFVDKYNALRNEGKPFEEARKLALSMVTGLEIKK